jgi:hypothetical protein
VAGRGRFKAPLFHIDPGKLRLQRLDPVIVRPVTIPFWEVIGLYWKSLRSTLTRALPSLPVMRGNLRRRTSDRAAS